MWQAKTTDLHSADSNSHRHRCGPCACHRSCCASCKALRRATIVYKILSPVEVNSSKIYNSCLGELIANYGACKFGGRCSRSTCTVRYTGPPRHTFWCTSSSFNFVANLYDKFNGQAPRRGLIYQKLD